MNNYVRNQTFLKLLVLEMRPLRFIKGELKVASRTPFQMERSHKHDL